MFSLYFNFSDKDTKIVTLKEQDKVIDKIVFSDDGSIEAIDNILKNNNLDITDIKFADFNQEGESFTGTRLASAISNTINLFLGNTKEYLDIKLPKYKSAPHLTWSEKNT